MHIVQPRGVDRKRSSCATPAVASWHIVPHAPYAGCVTVTKGRETAGYLVAEVANPDGRGWRFSKFSGQSEGPYHVALDARTGYMACDCKGATLGGCPRCRHVVAVEWLLEHEAAAEAPKETQRVCAWCQKSMGAVPGQGGTTHGICPECLTRELADLPSEAPTDDGDTRCRHCSAATDTPGDEYCSTRCADAYAEGLDAERAADAPACDECGARMLPYNDRLFVCETCTGWMAVEQPDLEAVFG
jgi:hypothetical protein